MNREGVFALAQAGREACRFQVARCACWSVLSGLGKAVGAGLLGSIQVQHPRSQEC